MFSAIGVSQLLGISESLLSLSKKLTPSVCRISCFIGVGRFVEANSGVGSKVECFFCEF